MANSNRTLIDITMPSLGADMSDGTLLEWRVKPGDRVEKGDIIAVIETNKGAIEMESFHQGVISELLVEPEIKLPVGSVLARMESDSPVTATLDSTGSVTPIRQPTPESAAPPQPSAEVAAKEASPVITPSQQTTYTAPPKSDRQWASPMARKNAYLAGIDLTALSGSGPQGAVLLRDLDGKVSSRPKEAITEVDSAKPGMSPMRQAISDAMSRSKREIPHYYLSLEINLTKAQQWLSEQNQTREPEQRLLLPALLLRAIADQLTRFADLNGFYHDGHFSPAAEVNIGNTISLREGGLVIPAILDADQLTLDQIMDALRDLAERGRRGRLRSTEVSAGTITVTSIGERGADSITGVIYPPQVAIIGLGRLRQVPVVNDGEIAIGEVMTVTLAADHRVSDGITGARFLHAVAKQLQRPEDL
ncbi:dihydrolipoamide acetyltransferase family protein [Vibrio sp.]|uniref:dihydrolipoamide acetyltransferase family protein n=1 Tax=Vibrio sp. TaxID=678 RepID=UPI003D0FA7BB